MSMPFLLFDLLSGNAIAAFASENDVLNALREAAADDGVESIENLSLLFLKDGHPTLIAMEDDLVQRALGNDHLARPGTKAAMSRSRSAAS